VLDHHVTSAVTAALVTTAAPSAVATLASTQRRRVTPWVQTSTFVDCSSSRPITVAPTTPSTTGNAMLRWIVSTIAP
jgi:hypothetical protein